MIVYLGMILGIIASLVAITASISLVLNEWRAWRHHVKRTGQWFGLVGLFVVIPTIVNAACSAGPGANTWTAGAGTPADVASCHGFAAAGDTILIPAGTFTWGASVTLTKQVSVQGNGQGFNITGTTFSWNAGDTVLVSTLASGSELFLIQPATDIAINVSQIGFDLGAIKSGRAAITVKNNNPGSFPLTQIRIHHNTLLGGGNSPGGVVAVGWPEFLIDNNTFINVYSGVYAYNRQPGDVGVWNLRYNASNVCAGHGPLCAGTIHALFVEHNTFLHNSSISPPSNVNLDGDTYTQEGISIVSRFNVYDYSKITGSPFIEVVDDHGNFSVFGQGYCNNVGTVCARSMILHEWYNNTVIGPVSWVWDTRGGTLLAHDNTFTGAIGTVGEFRDEESSLSSQFSPLRTVWPAQDLLINTYLWNNKINGVDLSASNISLNTPQDATFILPEGDASGNQSWTLRQPRGTNGHYCNYTGLPGASNTAPTAFGVGTLVCTQGPAVVDAFYPYTPFIDPHPLAGGGSGPSPPQTGSFTGAFGRALYWIEMLMPLVGLGWHFRRYALAAILLGAGGMHTAYLGVWLLTERSTVTLKQGATRAALVYLDWQRPKE